MNGDLISGNYTKSSLNRPFAIILLSLLLIYPGPVIYSHFAKANWVKSCNPQWIENAKNYERAVTNSDSLDYVFYGQRFADPWIAARSKLNVGYECFMNLYPEHLQAIESFNANLIEYQRQKNMGIKLLPPNFQYDQYSKVEYLCYSPSLLEFRFRFQCDTFLNVP